MSYSARQIHCLERMGIVPWICSTQSGILPAVQSDTGEVVALPAATTPGNIDELCYWLPAQQLIHFDYRGTVAHCVGQPEAQLLVVCEASTSAKLADVPLSREESQLFDLMMRAIELNRSHVCLCAVGGAEGGPAEQIQDRQSVSDLCTSQTRAVLFFSQSVDDESSGGSAGRFDSPPVPFWRITHPGQLLVNPQRKREAWESLKAIRALLGRE